MTVPTSVEVIVVALAAALLVFVLARGRDEAAVRHDQAPLRPPRVIFDKADESVVQKARERRERAAEIRRKAVRIEAGGELASPVADLRFRRRGL